MPNDSLDRLFLIKMLYRHRYIGYLQMTLHMQYFAHHSIESHKHESTPINTVCSKEI